MIQFENPDFYTIGDLKKLCKKNTIIFSNGEKEITIRLGKDMFLYQNDYHGIQDAVGDVQNWITF